MRHKTAACVFWLTLLICGLIIYAHSRAGREERQRAIEETNLTALDYEARAAIVDRWLTARTEEEYERGKR